MTAVLVPNAARALAANHAGAHGMIGVALVPIQGTAGGRGDAGHDVAAYAMLRQIRGCTIPELVEIDRKAPARIHVRKPIPQTKIPVRNVCDPAPPPADRPEHAP